MGEKVVKMGSFSFRITFIRIVLLLVALFGASIMLYRLIFGLGAATNLNDSWPFGLWIAVDVMLGVALAAGGFTTAGLVYIFNLKEYKPLAKPAILTAWLGYLLVIVGLGMDVGLWYNWWRPIFNWGYTSVLFEVFICVLAYNVVLLVEFLPVLSKRFNWKKVYEVSTFVAIPAVIAGIILSSMHQSSLGALFLIMPEKMNPLWYTSLLPWLFLLSAIAVGPAMVTFESFLASRTYNMEFEKDILGRLIKGVALISAVYVALKLWDLEARGYLSALFDGTLASNMFLVELALFIIPTLLIIFNSKRLSQKTIVAGAVLIVAGVVVNRLNVLFMGLYQAAHMSYFPALTEFAVTFGIISMGCLAYLFIVENFEVFTHEEVKLPKESAPVMTISRGSKQESF
ncbi:MAG: NrfD/PsrC family molybdoenzyme membrane anchor subunit [Bacillota bacterium]